MVLFAAMLVLLTLMVQAPLLGPVIRALKLTVAGPERLDVRRRAVAKLDKATRRAMQQLRDDEDEMLQGAGLNDDDGDDDDDDGDHDHDHDCPSQFVAPSFPQLLFPCIARFHHISLPHPRPQTGVNWDQVAADVDISKYYEEFVDPSKHKPGWAHRMCSRFARWLARCLCSCCRRREAKQEAAEEDAESPMSDNGGNGSAPHAVEMDETTVDGGTSVEMTTQMSNRGVGTEPSDMLDDTAGGIFGQAKSLYVAWGAVGQLVLVVKDVCVWHLRCCLLPLLSVLVCPFSPFSHPYTLFFAYVVSASNERTIQFAVYPACTHAQRCQIAHTPPRVFVSSCVWH